MLVFEIFTILQLFEDVHWKNMLHASNISFYAPSLCSSELANQT
jgi:hypothetical protein